MLTRMDEGGKRVSAIVAAILADWTLANLDPRHSPALNLAIADAVEKAERILQEGNDIRS
jgi:hypothetical protein